MTEGPIAVWDWTLPVGDLTPDDVIEQCQVLFKKWSFQKEEGKENGYLHYQGRGSLLGSKMRLPQLIELTKQAGWTGFYARPSSNNSQKGPSFYTMKLDTRIDGPWTDRDVREKIYIPRQYRGILDKLYPWQQDIWESADEFDARTINLIYDSDGNNGKSTIASVMDLHRRGIDLPPMNDSEKLIQSVADILMAREIREPKVVFVDLPRAMDKRKLGGLYTAIEQIKKGKVYDVRYTYKEWWFDSPQVWVFSNIEPDVTLLSRDRWRLWEISGKCLVPFVPIT